MVCRASGAEQTSEEGEKRDEVARVYATPREWRGRQMGPIREMETASREEETSGPELEGSETSGVKLFQNRRCGLDQDQ